MKITRIWNLESGFWFPLSSRQSIYPIADQEHFGGTSWTTKIENGWMRFKVQNMERTSARCFRRGLVRTLVCIPAVLLVSFWRELTYIVDRTSELKRIDHFCCDKNVPTRRLKHSSNRDLNVICCWLLQMLSLTTAMIMTRSFQWSSPKSCVATLSLPSTSLLIQKPQWCQNSTSFIEKNK